MKVPKVKLYEHPEVFKKLNTEEMIYFYKSYCKVFEQQNKSENQKPWR